MTARLDDYTRVLLTVIAVLLTLVAVGLWTHTPSSISTAQARLPDSGLQLNQIILELQRTRTSMDGVANLLRSGQAKVQIIEPAPVPVPPPPAVIK